MTMSGKDLKEQLEKLGNRRVTVVVEEDRGSVAQFHTDSLEFLQRQGFDTSLLIPESQYLGIKLPRVMEKRQVFNLRQVVEGMQEEVAPQVKETEARNPVVRAIVRGVREKADGKTLKVGDRVKVIAEKLGGLRGLTGKVEELLPPKGVRVQLDGRRGRTFYQEELEKG